MYMDSSVLMSGSQMLESPSCQGPTHTLARENCSLFVRLRTLTVHTALKADQIIFMPESDSGRTFPEPYAEADSYDSYDTSLPSKEEPPSLDPRDIDLPAQDEFEPNDEDTSIESKVRSLVVSKDKPLAIRSTEDLLFIAADAIKTR